MSVPPAFSDVSKASNDASRSYGLTWDGQLIHLQLLNKDFYHIAAGNCSRRIDSMEQVKLMVI